MTNAQSLEAREGTDRTHIAHLPTMLSAAFGISRSEARRAIAQGGVRLNDERVHVLDLPTSYLRGKGLYLGKRRSVRIDDSGPWTTG